MALFCIAYIFASARRVFDIGLDAEQVEASQFDELLSYKKRKRKKGSKKATSGKLSVLLEFRGGSMAPFLYGHVFAPVQHKFDI